MFVLDEQLSFYATQICIEWRKEEMEKIDEMMSGPERKAALAALLDQEAYLISCIGQHKSRANVENKELRTKNFLNKVCLRTIVIYQLYLGFL